VDFNTLQLSGVDGVYIADMSIFSQPLEVNHQYVSLALGHHIAQIIN